uniref:Uncharacterized protein n=1 Tax=Glossina pallidipes TaxID=7398 RepID=A0A1A9ZK24_GLOPL
MNLTIFIKAWQLLNGERATGNIQFFLHRGLSKRLYTQQQPQQQRNGGNLNNEIVEVGGEYITTQKTTINRILQKKPYNNNFPLFVHFKPFESWRMLHTLNGGHCATLCHQTLQAD